MTGVRHFILSISMGVGLIFVIAPAPVWAADTELGAGSVRPDGDWPPVIGAWFWGKEELEPEAFKPFLDAVVARSPYTLLPTGCRHIEVVEPGMHDQVGKAVRYANSLGLRIALEVDIRVARQAFRAAYPDEQQQELVLKMVGFTKEPFAEVVFQGKDTTDHMTGTLPPYECLGTRLVRVYSFVRDADGIDPSTVRDITGDGVVATADGRRKLTVRVPRQSGREACVIAAHEILTPAVFAPHLIEYQRAIIRQYADIPLAGIMKDEWGFPPDHTGNPAHDRYWYSRHMAVAYAKASNGRDLIRDTLLMFAGERGRDNARQAAINCYRKLCRTRCVEIEDDYHRAGKETFGKDAFIGTAPTWTPYPGAQEFRKNGLSWWDATRDIGQSDETTPYPCRTSLAKRWGLFVAGEVDKSAVASEAAAADAAIELAAAAASLADADVAAAGADFYATTDAVLADAAPRSQRNGQGNGLLDEVVAGTLPHWINPRMRPWFHRRRQRRPPKWIMVGRGDMRRARPQSAMKAVDPHVQLGAIIWHPFEQWNQTVLRITGRQIDFGIEHTYIPGFHRDTTSDQSRLLMQACVVCGVRLQKVYDDLNRLVEQETGQTDLNWAVTEYNGHFVQSKPVPYRQSLGNALRNAEHLRVMMHLRNHIVLANFWEFANEYWGMVRGYVHHGEQPVKQANFYVYQLYNEHFGDTLITSRVSCGHWDFPGAAGVPARSGEPATFQLQEANLLSTDYRWKLGNNPRVSQRTEGRTVVAEFSGQDTNYYHAQVVLPATAADSLTPWAGKRARSRSPVVPFRSHVMKEIKTVIQTFMLPSTSTA